MIYHCWKKMLFITSYTPQLPVSSKCCRPIEHIAHKPAGKLPFGSNRYAEQDLWALMRSERYANALISMLHT